MNLGINHRCVLAAYRLSFVSKKKLFAVAANIYVYANFVLHLFVTICIIVI